jgi:putative hydrolase of the HAD superfamily
MLKVVFFDAAGTLFDTREPVGLSYARIAREYGVDTSAAQVNAAFRRVFREASALAFGSGHTAEELRRLERRWWRDLVANTFAGFGAFTDFDAYFESLFTFFADPANWVADPEAAAALDELRMHGLRLGVISNFDHRLYPILDGLGLRRHFDSVTISSEAGSAKPSANLFRAALDKHSVSPAEALHVGDSEHLDLAGAAGAGIAAILIDRKATVRITLAGRTARIAALSALREASERLPFP